MSTTLGEGLAPVERDSLSGLVADQIQDWILDGGLEPGAQLPSERKLADLMQVSRIVIREALKLLQQRGLVHVEAGRGGFVSEVTPSAIVEPLRIYVRQNDVRLRDLQEMRDVLETAMVVRAVDRADPESLKILESALHRHERALELMETEGLEGHGFDEFVHADVEFHLAVAMASGNLFYTLILDALSGLMEEVRRVASRDLASIERALGYHRAIYEALKSGDRDAAVEQMQAHMANVSEMVDRHGDDVDQDAEAEGNA